MLQKAPEGKLLAGSLYFLFLLCIVIWLVLVIDHKRVSTPFIISLQMLILTVCFLGADLMMYRLQEGGRHTIAFIFVTAMIVPFIGKKQGEVQTGVESVDTTGHDSRVDWKIGVARTALPSLALGCVLVSVFIALGKLPYEFSVPYKTEERVADLENLKAQLEESITIEPNEPCYENTIIWPIWDQVEGETVVFDWGMLYAVPAGMGINACDGGYVEAQLGNLKCGYIATTPGSDVAKWCAENGKTLVENSNSITIYQ
jgi:hypothetical protein